MKTGIIVYVPGNQRYKDFDEKSAVKNLKLDADRVDLVISDEKNYDIMYAWWSMIVKGMRRVICITGEFITQSEIKLTGRQMQLCAF